jgi:DNA-binding FadR family transcriptional regulator
MTTDDASSAGPSEISDRLANDRLSADLAGILSELGVGGRLPAERTLAVQLGVSRTALRDRIQLLEALGVLDRKQGSGTYIRELDPTGLALSLDIAIAACGLSPDSVIGVRRALERQAAIEAARAADPQALEQMRLAVEAIVDNADQATVDSADYALHFQLMRAARNAALVFFGDALAAVIWRVIAARRVQMGRVRTEHEVMVTVHKAIYDAIVAGDPERAAAAVDAHFETYERLQAELEADHDERR